MRNILASLFRRGYGLFSFILAALLAQYIRTPCRRQQVRVRQVDFRRQRSCLATVGQKQLNVRKLWMSIACGSLRAVHCLARNDHPLKLPYVNSQLEKSFVFWF